MVTHSVLNVYASEVGGSASRSVSVVDASSGATHPERLHIISSMSIENASLRRAMSMGVENSRCVYKILF